MISSRNTGLLALLAVLGAPACAATPPSDTGEMPPEILLKGVGFRFFRGSELRAVGRAEKATFKKDTGDGTAQGVRARFLPSESRSELEIVTRELTGNVRTQQAVATGGVRLSETGGAAGVTRSARLDGLIRKAEGDDPVDVVGAGYRMHAESGFALDFATPGGLTLLGPVDTRIGGLR